MKRFHCFVLLVLTAGCSPASSPGIGAPAAAVVTPAPAKAEELTMFENSTFCKQYACAAGESWPLNNGDTNHTYTLNLRPSVLLEIQTKNSQVRGYGLMFSERDRLNASQLKVVDGMLGTIERTETAGAVRQFVRANIERSVFQIRQAKSIRFGRFELWAGKVGNDKTVSIEATSAGTVIGSAGSEPQAKARLVSSKVAARYSTAVILLVPSNTTQMELTELLNALRVARANGRLSQFIPATTAGGSKGDFAAVMLFVMSDAAWATAPRLKSFVNGSDSGISVAEKEFGRRIMGYYYLSTVMAAMEEFGTIGYADEGHQYTATYKKVF